ncbi:MAG: CDP-alcohol phosphatidyltransferase family protein [Pseudomonadales bacterium]|nr:CDP-alcohol phosphatidyltransferase family protein [Pseudomonadales bacterium]
MMFTWPNALSFARILLTPLLFALALYQQPVWYLVVVAATIFTDLLDGYLARRLNQVSRLGSQLDSWGDFFVYTTMALGAWILWPAVVQREALYCVLLACSFVLPVLLGLVKFASTTSYHTWSTKAAVALGVIGYFLLFGGLAEWPFRAAALLAVYAGIEEIAITLVLPKPRADVRSLRQARAIARVKP